MEPVSPRAQIREVWFDRGDIRYLLTACLGGDCPYEGGLAVLKKGKVLSKSRCGDGPDAVEPGPVAQPRRRRHAGSLVG